MGDKNFGHNLNWVMRISKKDRSSLRNPLDIKYLKDEVNMKSYIPESNFISFFTKSGQSVIDPFAGIGTTLVACQRTKRKGIGIELNKKYQQPILALINALSHTENVQVNNSKIIDSHNQINEINFDYSSTEYIKEENIKYFWSN